MDEETLGMLADAVRDMSNIEHEITSRSERSWVDNPDEVVEGILRVLDLRGYRIVRGATA
jgi:hypothetical protein